MPNKLLNYFKEVHQDFSHNYLIDYLNLDFPTESKDFLAISFDQLLKASQEKQLNLFQQMAAKVPAYKDFLQKNSIKPEKIVTHQDLSAVPFIDKNNYLRQYSIPELCWPGSFHQQNMVSVSSGSSGDPFFWFRSSWQEFEATLNHEMLLRDFFACDNQRTLLIVSFAMGMYVAGVLTQNCGQHISQKGLPLTVISPGISITENVRIIKELAKYYDQIIIAGYPPLVKDVIDFGQQQGIDWSSFKIKFIFAGEGFSEKWRQTLLHKAGVTDLVKDSFSIYGSADANMLAFETILSIKIRQLVDADSKKYSDFYDQQNRLPGIFQFNPLSRYFEQLADELIFSADSGIPLLRYNIHDVGKVIGFTDMQAKIGNEHFAGNNYSWPFVLLYGKDKTISFYGLLIYPDNIRIALENDVLKEKVSGRVLFARKEDVEGNHYLQAEIELAPKVEPNNDLASLIQQEITKSLSQANMEYNKLRSYLGERALPKINLYPYGSSEIFSRTNKQNWLTS